MSKTFKETSGITINAKIYPLAVVESAAYIFIDRAYIILDGNPETEIIVYIIPKKGHEKDQLELEFHNELINYSNYKNFADKNRDLRIAILQRALVTNNPGLVNKDEDEELDEETKKLLKELEDEEDFDDSDEIAIPWEKKHKKKIKKGKKDAKKRKNKSK